MTGFSLSLMTYFGHMENFIPTDHQEFGEVLDTNKVFLQAIRTRINYIAGAILVSIIWDFIFYNFLSPEFLTSGFGLLILAVPWGISAFFLFVLYAKIREAFWKKLAEKYGWEYASHKNISGEKALIFNIGDSKEAWHGISGKYNNQPFHIFEYEYSQGEGRSKSTYDFTIFEIKFSGTFPHLYLNYKNDWYSARQALFTSLAKISLPTEFEKKFKLYAPKEYEIETLEIFTPDVFSYLLEAGWNHDMEFVDGELVIYNKSKFRSFEALDAELTKIKKFIDILSPKLNRLKLTQIGDISPSLK